jgi:HK97 family phage portal protein
MAWSKTVAAAVGLRVDDDAPTLLSAATPAHPFDRELVSLAEGTNGLATAIAHSMKTAMSSSAYVAFDNADDQGGMFGSEFEIRTTAGRIKALYAREPWIYTAATKIARTMSSLPMRVYPVGADDKAKPLEKHPLNALLRSGSPMRSPVELRWCAHLDQVLGGNSFLVLEENMKTVADLANVEMCNLVFKPDNSGVLALEVYGTNQYGRQSVTRFPWEQVVHHKFPNPYQPFYGLSPFAAAARPILLDRYKNEFEMAFYLRGATSTGVVETTEDLSKSRFKRLMLSFEQAFTGKANWWRTLFLPKGATWKASSLTMEQMQHLEGLRENRKTILAVLGIPPSQVGLVEDVNRATSEQQERDYWLNTIMPMAIFYASGWNQSHLVQTVYGGKVEVRPDFSGIEALEGTVASRGEKAKAMETTLWIDEIRGSVWGLDPLPDGKGERFVAEIRGTPSGAPGALALGAPPAQVKAEAAPDGYEIQTLVFDKAQFPLQTDAAAWCTDHDYRTDNVAETKDTWRFRQQDGDRFDAATFKTIVVGHGVKAVIGKPKEKTVTPEERRAALKAAATGSQNRIEKKLGAELAMAVAAWVDELLTETAKAIREKRDVRNYLAAHRGARGDRFLLRAMPVYERAMDRGFAAAFAQVKAYPATEKSARFTGLDETDKEAVDVLKAKTRTGKRQQLAARGLDAFQGFDANRTEAVMQIIEDGQAQGQSFDEIAANIRAAYDEAYSGQADTIVRTEVLSAVSVGQQWNHEVLGQVFSTVKKQWLTQADALVRDDHAAFEELGEVDDSYVWRADDGSELAYPRDPGGSAGQVINCRCTMVSVIPDSAISNADAILETEG